jgi:GNAT superfamily N-acetyltransferase
MAEGAEQSRLEALRRQVAKARALKAAGATFESFDDPLNKNEKVVVARKDGKEVGKMVLYPASDRTNLKGAREVKEIWTDPQYRRQGIASTLFNEARLQRLNPVHSGKLTDEGRKFVGASGGTKLDPNFQDPELFKSAKQANKKTGRETARLIAQGRAQKNVNSLPRGFDPFIETLEEFNARGGSAASPRTIQPPELVRSLVDPEAIRVRDQLLRGRGRPSWANVGGTVNMGAGALNILGFLPMLMQGGRIAQGTETDPLFDTRGDRFRG